jgi:superfamily II DNA or RNA helicase
MDTKEALELKIKLTEVLSCFVDGYQFMPSYRAGVFDGKKYFFEMTSEGNMKIPKGLVQSIIKKFGNSMTNHYQPLRAPISVTTEQINDFIETLDLPFPPRDYQVEAVVKTINEARKICVMATSSGKSMTIYILMRFFLSLNMKGVLIVPNVGLVEQMFNDFSDYNYKTMDEDVHIIYAGKEKNFDKPITISTWQSTYKAKELFKDIDYIFIDEAHLAKGDSLSEILGASENCLYKVGFTGTLPKNHADRFSLTATLGKSEKIITAQGLIDRGFATPVNIINMYLNYPEEDKSLVKRMKYPQEIKFIEEHYQRNDYLAKLAIQATKKYGNTLMLYNTINHGEFLLKLVLQNKFGLENVQVLEKITKMRLEKALALEPEKLFTISPLTPKDRKLISKYMDESEIEAKFDNLSKYNIYLIKGEIDGEVRNQIRGFVENVDDAIVIASYGTTSTGTSIKRIHNIFLVSSTKSSIRLLQSVGRGMRQHTEKDMMRLFDFVDDFSHKTKTGKVQNKNHVLKHSYERLDNYIDQGFPIIEKEINL